MATGQPPGWPKDDPIPVMVLACWRRHALGLRSTRLGLADSSHPDDVCRLDRQSLFENLPAATLGAVVIDAMLGVVTFGPMRRYFRVSRADWFFFTAAMLGILFVDIIDGILIGVVLSLLLLIARASKPAVRLMGRT